MKNRVATLEQCWLSLLTSLTVHQRCDSRLICGIQTVSKIKSRLKMPWGKIFPENNWPAIICLCFSLPWWQGLYFYSACARNWSVQPAGDSRWEMEPRSQCRTDYPLCDVHAERAQHWLSGQHRCCKAVQRWPRRLQKEGAQAGAEVSGLYVVSGSCFFNQTLEP